MFDAVAHLAAAKARIVLRIALRNTVFLGAIRQFWPRLKRPRLALIFADLFLGTLLDLLAGRLKHLMLDELAFDAENDEVFSEAEETGEFLHRYSHAKLDQFQTL